MAYYSYNGGILTNPDISDDLGKVFAAYAGAKVPPKVKPHTTLELPPGGVVTVECWCYCGAHTSFAMTDGGALNCPTCKRSICKWCGTSPEAHNRGVCPGGGEALTGYAPILFGLGEIFRSKKPYEPKI